MKWTCENGSLVVRGIGTREMGMSAPVVECPECGAELAAGDVEVGEIIVCRSAVSSSKC